MAQQDPLVTIADREAKLRFDLAVYGIDPVLKATHRFTDRCAVRVDKDGDGVAVVTLKALSSMTNLEAAAGELANEVLDQRLRARLQAETEPIRRLILAQAFSRTNLLHPALDGRPPSAEPQGTTSTR